jgi:hypothetical protein
MRDGKLPTDVTLLDVLVDGFEKNEILDGFHWRELPMPDEAAAVGKFGSLFDEARQWKGAPTVDRRDGGRKLAAWPDLEIRQAGRAIMVRARAPWFARWWHDRSTWEGDPMAEIFRWLDEERQRR